MKTPPTIIILFEKTKTCAWQSKVVAELSAEFSDKYVKALNISNFCKKNRFGYSFLASLFRLHRKLENIIYGKEINRINKLCNVDSSDIEFGEGQSHQTDAIIVDTINKFVEEGTENLIINLTAYNIRANKLLKSNIHYWEYKTSLLENQCKDFFGFWELATNQGQLFGELLVSYKNNCFSISKTYSYLHRYSIEKTILNHHWKIASHIVFETKRFISNNCNYSVELAPENYISLAILDMTRLWGHYFIYIFKVTVQRAMSVFFTAKWHLLFSKIKSEDDILGLNVGDFMKTGKLAESEYADPFIVFNKESSEYHLFYEEMPPKNGKGHLSYSKFDPKSNTFSNTQPIIERKEHLSFPNPFLYNGNWYIIPESQASKSIMLYKCVEYPTRWEFEKNLFDGIEATDTEIIYSDGLWWLFTCLKNEQMLYNYDDLHLFYSKSPLSGWKAHPLNPVVSDVKTARNAGKIFNLDGHLIRPSQNCRYRYGFGLNLNRILTLTTDDYKEEVIKKFLPEKTKIKNIHTFNFANNIVFIDVK